MALKELIKAIAMELVDHPDQVVVTEIASEHNCLIELRVAKDDVGKVIGKEGRTAQSMRTILAAVSTKLGKAQHAGQSGSAAGEARAKREAGGAPPE
jgi:uncharacterized protein